MDDSVVQDDLIDRWVSKSSCRVCLVDYKKVLRQTTTIDFRGERVESVAATSFAVSHRKGPIFRAGERDSFCTREAAASSSAASSHQQSLRPSFDVISAAALALLETHQEKFRGENVPPAAEAELRCVFPSSNNVRIHSGSAQVFERGVDFLLFSRTPAAPT